MSGLFGGGDKPKVPEVKEIAVPVVNQDQVDRNTEDIVRRRKGTAATILTDPLSNNSTAGAVTGKTLLGS